MTRWHVATSLLLVALWSGGCGGEPQREATRAGRGRADLAVSLRVNPAVVAPHAPVRAVFGARNDADTAVTLRFATAQRYEFTVLDAAGNAVWRWSAGRTFAAAAGEQTVPPGWEINYEEQFAAPAAAGAYRVIAAVAAEGGSPSAVANFTVR